MKNIFIKYMTVLMFITFILPVQTVFAKEELSDEDIYKERLALYYKTEATTNIPWYYYAAIDSYERGLRQARNDLPKEEGLIAIYFSKEKWVGALNPNIDDDNALSISLFHGIGEDGNSDGKASIIDDEDLLYTFGKMISKFGSSEENIRIALWDYYERDKAIELITGHAKVYKTFNTLNLKERSFPMPLQYNYSYRSTWGDGRGWGGRRIHEGTDIFADYGTPVKATNYGVIELKGWNKFGGWRIGIRDVNNVYHYYAHLSSYKEGIERGSVVEPGTVIGYVGSSGYGKPGTSGKFPPHLHYGMYRDNGYFEWSFDPYQSLRIWEQRDRKK